MVDGVDYCEEYRHVSWDKCGDIFKDQILGPRWRDLIQPLEDVKSFDDLIQMAEGSLCRDALTVEEAWPYVRSALEDFIALHGIKESCWMRGPDDLVTVAKKFFPEHPQRQCMSMIYMARLYMKGYGKGFEPHSLFNSPHMPEDHSHRYGYRFLFYSGVIGEFEFFAAKETRFLVRVNPVFSLLEHLVSLSKNIILVPVQYRGDLAGHNQYSKGILDVVLENEEISSTTFFVAMENFVKNARDNVIKGVKDIIRENWKQYGLEYLLGASFMLYESFCKNLRVSQSSGLMELSLEAMHKLLINACLVEGPVSGRLKKIMRGLGYRVPSLFKPLLMGRGGEIVEGLHRSLDIVEGATVYAALKEEWGVSKGDKESVGCYLGSLISAVFSYMKARNPHVDDVSFINVGKVPDEEMMMFVFSNQSNFLCSKSVNNVQTGDYISVFFIPTKSRINSMTLCEQNQTLYAMSMELKDMLCRFLDNKKSIPLLLSAMKNVGVQDVSDIIAVKRADLSDEEALLSFMRKTKKHKLHTVEQALDYVCAFHADAQMSNWLFNADTRLSALGKIILCDLHVRNIKGSCTAEERAIIDSNRHYEALSALLENLVGVNIAFTSDSISFHDELLYWYHGRHLVQFSKHIYLNKKSIYEQCLAIQKRKEVLSAFRMYDQGIDRAILGYFSNEHYSCGFLCALIGAKLFFEEEHSDVVGENTHLAFSLRLQDLRLGENSDGCKVLCEGIGEQLSLSVEDTRHIVLWLYRRIMAYQLVIIAARAAQN